MGTAIIIVVLVIIVIFAVKSGIKHGKGEGGCCGSGGTMKEDKKVLAGDIIATKLVTIEGMHCDNCKNSIKAIAKRCGIEKNVTWHVARHTYATTVCLSNDVPIETLSKMLGHRSIRTTQIYAKITAEKVSRDMEKLAQRIEQMESFICQAI